MYNTHIPNHRVLKRMILSFLPQSKEAHCHTETKIRGTMLRAGIELYKRRYGSLPDTLEALVNQGILRLVPTDPFGFDTTTRKYNAFRYDRENDKVYSIGPDLTDDKLKIEWAGSKSNDRGDISF